MIGSLIDRAMRRANTTLLLACLAGVILVALLVIANIRYLYNFMLGPFDATPQALNAVRDITVQKQYWVRVTGYDIYDLDIQYVTTSDSGKETVDFSYLALELGDQLLLVKQPGSPRLETTLTGSLLPITSEEQKEIIDYFVAEDPSLAGEFLPYLIHTGNFRTGGWLGIAFGALTLGACLYGLVTDLRRELDERTHPILKALSRFGALELTRGQLDLELAAEHPILSKKFHLTRSWLVYTAGSKFMATRFEDIAWYYLHIHTTRTYGIVVARTYSVVVCDRFGAQLMMAVGNKEPPALEVLDAIARRAPWAIGGYSQDLVKAWKKDRAGFLAQVEKRRQLINQPATPQSTPVDYSAGHSVNSGVVIDPPKQGG